jgi:hypothetical protein
MELIFMQFSPFSVIYYLLHPHILLGTFSSNIPGLSSSCMQFLLRRLIRRGLEGFKSKQRWYYPAICLMWFEETTNHPCLVSGLRIDREYSRLRYRNGQLNTTS